MSQMLLIKVLPVLLANSIWDAMKKRIFLWLTLVWGVLGLIIRFATGFHFEGGFLIGLAMLGISFLTRERIGYGDGIVVSALSMYVTLWELVEVLAIAFFLSGLVSLFLLAFCHKSKNYEIPFVPFLLVGTILVGIGELI